MTESSKHVDELTIMRLTDGELSAAGEARVRDHLLECATCQAAYEGLKAETQLLRAAVRQHDEALPAHLRPRHRDWSWLLVAVISLGTLGFSTLWTSVVQPALDNMRSVGLDGTSVATSVLIRSLLWRGWTDMLMRLVEGVLLLALIVVAAMILHWAWRRLRSLTAGAASLLLVSVAGFVFAAPDVHAAIIEFDAGTYVLREGETIETDLIVTGETVRIQGELHGDLIVVARFVDVSGEIQGDVLGFADEIEVSGSIHGNVRTGARLLDIEGNVARNVTAGGERIRLTAGSNVGGSFFAGAQETIVDAPVTRDVIVAAQNQEIHARIGGSALMLGETLTVGPNGAIGGDAKFYGATEPEISPTADLASPIDFERVEDDEEESRWSWLVKLVYFWAAAFVLGAAVMLASPERSELLVTKYVPEYGKSFIVGVLSVLVCFASSVAMLVTVVGIPLGATVFFFLGLGLYLAQAYVGAFVAREILGPPTSVAASLGRLALGLVLIQVGVALPVVGGVIMILVALWGFGSFTLFVLDRLPGGTDSTPATEAVVAEAS